MFIDIKLFMILYLVVMELKILVIIDVFLVWLIVLKLKCVDCLDELVFLLFGVCCFDMGKFFFLEFGILIFWKCEKEWWVGWCNVVSVIKIVGVYYFVYDDLFDVIDWV